MKKSFVGTFLFVAVIFVVSFFSVFSYSAFAADTPAINISSFEALDPSEYYFECSDKDELDKIISDFPKTISAYDELNNNIEIPVSWDCVFDDGRNLLFSPLINTDIYKITDDELLLDIVRMQIGIRSSDDSLHTMSSVTFEELNDEKVFLKQNEKGTCTLCAAAMLVRRAAMLNGNEEWEAVTESSMKSVAWLNGTGLYHNFTYAGISVSSKLETINETFLQDYLADHPEGIVIYSYSKPHAIIITDYTDGEFYCAEPSNGSPSGRISISEASINIKDCSRCWYVSSPQHLRLIDKDDSSDKDSVSDNNTPSDNSASDNKIPDKDSISDNTVSSNMPSDPITVSKADFSISYNSSIPFNGNKLTIDKLGDIIVSYGNKVYKAEKVQINKKKNTIQILKLEGADKSLNKQIKKATKGKLALEYKQKPYYVSESSKCVIKYKKDGESIKNVYLYFNGNKYKVKSGEYENNSPEKTLYFKSENLSGSWKY